MVELVVLLHTAPGEGLKNIIVVRTWVLFQVDSGLVSASLTELDAQSG
jgi:hypothetical protein